MPTGALPSTASRTTSALRPAGAFRLLAAFSREQSDPGRFYPLLARDSVALVERHMALGGRRSWTSAAARGTSPPPSAIAAPSACWSSRIPASCTGTVPLARPA